MNKPPAPLPAFKPPPLARVLVIFEDATQLRWLRLLTPGFRHCYAVVETPAGWVAYHPLSNGTRILFNGRWPARALAQWYNLNGAAVVVTEQHDPPPCQLPIRPFTCVEAVKRVLGRRWPWVFTPKHLFKKLCLEGNFFLDTSNNTE